MNRKSTFLALAATAALGLAMLSSSASAMGGHGMGGHGMGGHNMGGHNMGGHGGGHWQHHTNWRRPYWHVRYHHRPIWYGYGYGIRTVGYAPSPVAVAGPCTCLSKEYTPEGAVLFKDRCTNETAMNPPVQQNSEAEPQQQSAQYQQQYVQPRPQAR